MSREAFFNAVQTQIDAFERNRLIERLQRSEADLADYERLLCGLFHQVQFSSTTFSLAAAHMPVDLALARSYLFRHAHEESEHWRWILNDLTEVGYRGESPLVTSPAAPTAAYIGYNYFIASTMPTGRLAIAAVLEGLGARFGARYGQLLLSELHLQPRQMQFLLGHGESDVVHIQELQDILDATVESDAQWQSLAGIASVAGTLYRAIYDACVIR